MAVYIARATGWVAGRRVEAGDKVDLTPEQAQYEPVDAVTEAKPSRTPRKTVEPNA